MYLPDVFQKNVKKKKAKQTEEWSGPSETM